METASFWTPLTLLLHAAPAAAGTANTDFYFFSEIVCSGGTAVSPELYGTVAAAMGSMLPAGASASRRPMLGPALLKLQL